jgi:HSP20 family molecular chaperone IbpA
MTTLTNNFIRAEIDVPGMRPHLDVHAHGHTVAIRGQRHGRSFYREVVFPPRTDMLNVHAHVADGVLCISAPYGTGRVEPGYHVVEIRPDFWACHPDAAPL